MQRMIHQNRTLSQPTQNNRPAKGSAPGQSPTRRLGKPPGLAAERFNRAHQSIEIAQSGVHIGVIRTLDTGSVNCRSVSPCSAISRSASSEGSMETIPTFPIPP